MTTHRSLNKLEFKAHMSIHNKVEVSEAKVADSNHTRDRFGKSHVVSDSVAQPRVRRLKKVLLPLLIILFAGPFAQANSNTNVQVESGPIDELVDKKIDPPEQKFAFYRDDDKSLELNEDGDPNMNLRF